MRRDLQPFAHVRLAIYVRKGATCRPLTSVHIAHLLKGMFPYLDNMRLFVDALNSSRALKSFSLCITIVAPMAPPTVTGIRHILTPFEGLRTDIKFDIHFHHMDCGVIYQGSEMLSIDLKPSSPEDVAYVERLEYQRGTLPAQGFGLPLVKEWIHFRTWLLAFFTEALPTRILDNLIYNVLVTDEDKQEILDLGRALNMPDYDGAVDPQAGYDLIRQMIIDIWMAHNTGDQTAFKQAKLAFHDWYMKAQTKTLQIMLDGPPRTSS